MSETATAPSAARFAPDEVWDQVREAYLGGLSAPACCRTFGVGLTALRNRAARDGWRRADMPWQPPFTHLDPEDEGVQLEEDIGGDLDLLRPFMLSRVAERRMMRAVLRGEATEVLRWHRVYQAMEALQLQEDRELACEDALRARMLPVEVDEVVEVDGVSPPST